MHKHIHTYIHTRVHTQTHTNIHTYIQLYKLINSMEQIRVQKSIAVPQIVKKFFAFSGSRRFIIVFTRARLFFLSWDRSIKSTYSHSIYLGCIFILPSRLGSSHPNVSFFQISSSNIWCHSIISHICHMPPFAFIFLWRCGPTRAMGSSFLRILDHTHRRITVGRTPMDEWSSSRRDLYLTTHNIHNRQTSMPPVGFEPTISAGERRQTYALERAATGTGTPIHILYIIKALWKLKQELVRRESKKVSKHTLP